MNITERTIALLGTTARDRVTGFTGMVSSVSFDAYGCVQAWLTPEVKDGKMGDGTWFDVKRLEPKGKRKMPAPDFSGVYGSENGPEAKGAPRAG